MKRVLTGIKATGVHLGNWIGAIQPALDLAEQKDVESFLFIANYHALNSVSEPHKLKQITYEVAATWLALGLDPKKTVLYCQSDIPEIFELSVILSALSPKGLMNRAHAYKAKVQENKEKIDQYQNTPDNYEDLLDEGVNIGLYTYPILMSADILAFNADQVPVGVDQSQHLEIARDLASKFNHSYAKNEGFRFKVPELLTVKPRVGQNQQDVLLPGLDGRKMSASYNNHIPIFLPEKKLRKMIMKIVTDSKPPEEPKSTEGNHLFQFYKIFASSEQAENMKKRYQEGIGWGEVKQEVFEILNAKLAEPRKVYETYMNDLSQLDKILDEGAKKAREVSSCTLKDVRKAIGVNRI